MQKKYGFAPLGGADSAVKQLIFGGNAARMYRINLKAAECLGVSLPLSVLHQADRIIR